MHRAGPTVYEPDREHADGAPTSPFGPGSEKFLGRNARRKDDVWQTGRFDANAGALASGALEYIKRKSDAQGLRGVGFQISW